MVWTCKIDLELLRKKCTQPPVCKVVHITGLCLNKEIVPKAVKKPTTPLGRNFSYFEFPQNNFPASSVNPGLKTNYRKFPSPFVDHADLSTEVHFSFVQLWQNRSRWVLPLKKTFHDGAACIVALQPSIGCNRHSVYTSINPVYLHTCIIAHSEENLDVQFSFYS